MNPLQLLSSIPADAWRTLHRQALARGCGRVLNRDEERLAATDELVALAVPELVRLGVLALVAAGGSEAPRECTDALSGAAATLVRLLDRAIAAHARDTGYVTDAWLDRAFECSHVRAHIVSTLARDELPLGLLVEVSAEGVAQAVMALHRDRLGVPEVLSDALASLLVVFASGTVTGADPW